MGTPNASSLGFFKTLRFIEGVAICRRDKLVIRFARTRDCVLNLASRHSEISAMPWGVGFTVTSHRTARSSWGVYS